MTIESLDRYERLPGAYFVARMPWTHKEVKALRMLLRSVGIYSGIKYESATQKPILRLSYGRGVDEFDSVYRESHLHAGDYVTFRRCRDGKSWSVITYKRDHFECRYRRIKP